MGAALERPQCHGKLGSLKTRSAPTYSCPLSPPFEKKSVVTNRQFAPLGYVPFRDDDVGRVEGGEGAGLVPGEGAAGAGGGRAEGRRRNLAAGGLRLGFPIRCYR